MVLVFAGNFTPMAGAISCHYSSGYCQKLQMLIFISAESALRILILICRTKHPGINRIIENIRSSRESGRQPYNMLPGRYTMSLVRKQHFAIFLSRAEKNTIHSAFWRSSEILFFFSWHGRPETYIDRIDKVIYANIVLYMPQQIEFSCVIVLYVNLARSQKATGIREVLIRILISSKVNE